MNCKQSIVKEVKDVINFLSVADKMSEERIADSIDNLAQSAWKEVLDKAFSIVKLEICLKKVVILNEGSLLHIG